MEEIFNKASASLAPFLEMSGYKPKTTFWQDFTIADQFGERAIKDTYNRAFKEWKNDVVYITELTMVLNWKLWQHSKDNLDIAKLYEDLWMELDCWCLENLKDDDKMYYLKTTD